MSVAITGATGLVGRFFVEQALGAGQAVTVLSRSAPPRGMFSGPVTHQPYQLGNAPKIAAKTLIHCAFAHVPGRYRGGEGNDPDGFRAANLHGSTVLFKAARDSGVRRVVFLSSRAIYGDQPPGLVPETAAPNPSTLYGVVKLAAEQALADLSGPDFTGHPLRATGVYGPAAPGNPHKWATLFRDFQRGAPIAPRKGTEVHGADLARAAEALKSAPSGAYNVTDMLLDRRDLLRRVAGLTGCTHPLPAPADGPFSAMDASKLRGYGWHPGGMALLQKTLPELI